MKRGRCLSAQQVEVGILSLARISSQEGILLMSRLVRAVSVVQLPKTINGEAERLFFAEMRDVASTDRPRIVLNCANLVEVSLEAIRLLLACLEEAMKRNGDVRLASLPGTSKAILQSAGMERLFRMFDTDIEAIKSFQQHGAVIDSLARRCKPSDSAKENAA
jgi:anti-sigma B factor antagonist